MTTAYADKSYVSLKRDLNNNLGRAGNSAINWLNARPVYISTKTSGFDQYSQIIELAVIDADLNVLYHSQFLPSVPIDEEAQSMHGINLSSLQDRPTWSKALPELRKLVAGRKIIMFNALFETRVMQQSCIAFGEPIEWVDNLHINCAMYLAANGYGTDNRYGTASFEYALLKAKVTGYSKTTGAVAANYALAMLVKNIAQYTIDINRGLQISLKVAS